jgi:hypothetical protein
MVPPIGVIKSEDSQMAGCGRRHSLSYGPSTNRAIRPGFRPLSPVNRARLHANSSASAAWQPCYLDAMFRSRFQSSFASLMAGGALVWIDEKVAANATPSEFI